MSVEAALNVTLFVVIGGPNGSVGIDHDGLIDFANEVEMTCPACGTTAAVLKSSMTEPHRTSGGANTLRAWIEAKRAVWRTR